MEFKQILAQFMATPTDKVDVDLSIGITNDQIEQLRNLFELRLTVQGITNATTDSTTSPINLLR